jgi:hypothetical protein
MCPRCARGNDILLRDVADGLYELVQIAAD